MTIWVLVALTVLGLFAIGVTLVLAYSADDPKLPCGHSEDDHSKIYSCSMLPRPDNRKEQEGSPDNRFKQAS